jgi:hypothetical protein
VNHSERYFRAFKTGNTDPHIPPHPLEFINCVALNEWYFRRQPLISAAFIMLPVKRCFLFEFILSLGHLNSIFYNSEP